MPLFTKPQFNNVWASTGAKLTPEVAKINQGWVVEIPPFEYDNWIRNRQDAMLAHLNQFGVPQWDSTVEYQAGKSYVQGTTTGVVYKALTTHSNVNPETDIQNNWTVAFESSGNSLLKVNNLSDVPDKAQARINLGIATTEFYDTRYLLKNSNLADVPNKASARGNMDVYSRQEVIDLISNAQPAGEVAAFARDTPPVGWLVCDGSLVSRVTYARLFSAIGSRFGSGNGSTTFQLPDLRGEFVRGWDNGRGADNGRVFGTFQADQNQSHNHSGTTSQGGSHNHYLSINTNVSGDHVHGVNDPGHGHQLDTNGVAAGIVGPTQGGLHAGVGRISSRTTRDITGISLGWSGNHSHNVSGNTQDSGNHTHSFTTNSVGGNESRPRNVALLYCIRT